MPTTLGRRLLAARTAAIPKITQRDVAKKFQLTPSSIHLWEAGKTEPNASTIAELARLYNVSCDWLLGVSGPRSTVLPRKNQAAVYTVPVVSSQELSSWRWETPEKWLQSAINYPEHTAAAIHITSDALHKTAPAGAYAIISKGHEPAPGLVVVAITGRAKEPMLRKLMREGGEDLLVADDPRFATHKVNKSTRIVGVVTEIVIRHIIV